MVSTTDVFAYGIAARDTFLYVPYGYDTLRVYSTADPRALRLLGFAPLQTHTWDVALAESVAVVATFNGLEAFSLEDPAHPHWRAALPTPGGPRRVVYSNPYFYTAMWEAGVGVYSAESLGLQEQARGAVPSISPRVSSNPVRNRCIISLDATNDAVTVRDVTGRVVPTGIVHLEAEQRLSLDLSRLAAGVYFVEVKSVRRSSSVKVVKQ